MHWSGFDASSERKFLPHLERELKKAAVSKRNIGEAAVMKNLGRWESIVFTAVSLVIFSAVALADPPSRVARLQYMTGDVSVQPGGECDA